MDMGSLHHYFKQKTIFVTGATGFLAKVFVEKLLRIQSDVKKLYLLLRASDDHAATQRFHHHIIGKDLFRALRDKLGEDFDCYMSERIAAVAGDVSLVNLGLNEANLEKMLPEIEVVVNFAATTNFDERFDIAMSVNTIGALHVLNFAKRCQKMQVLLHVSTAYVCGEAKDGEAIREEPFTMGQTLKEATDQLDIDAELGFLKKRIQELQAENASEKVIESAMKDYGLKRSKLYGWPNTYVFTKAMGEMLLSHLKDQIPLIIVRPTMVTSTYKEPFPGWVEGLRTMDAVIGGYGKGIVTCFLGDPMTILDLIPADIVINCMLAAMVNYCNEASENYIYHVGSSSRNPLRIPSLRDIAYLYFKNKPWTARNGKPVMIRSKGTLLTSNDSFHTYLIIRYRLPLMGLNLVNKMLCGSFQDVYSSSHRKIKRVIRMAELYKPYVFFKAVFDDSNTEKLRKATKLEDVGSIDWTDYMMNVHIPGLVKYAMK